MENRTRPRISIVIPAYNEEENLPILFEELAKLVASGKTDYEVVLVDDGSTDETYRVATKYREKYSFLRIAHHSRRRGITDALLTGFRIAKGDIFVFFPADLQYSPKDIPKLVHGIEEGCDIMCGWKVGAYEKKFVSSIYNYLSRKLFHIPIHDLNSIKAFKRDVVEKIPWRKDWHRYMVVMAYENGFEVDEVKVQLYPRRYGKSKLSPWRIPVGVLDMIAVHFQLSFMKKPMLLFGTIGGIFLIAGVVVGLIALYLRFGLGKGFRPLLYLVILLILAGLSLFALGFLAEAIASVNDRISKLEEKLFEK